MQVPRAHAAVILHAALGTEDAAVAPPEQEIPFGCSAIGKQTQNKEWWICWMYVKVVYRISTSAWSRYVLKARLQDDWSNLTMSYRKVCCLKDIGARTASTHQYREELELSMLKERAIDTIPLDISYI